MGGGRVNRNGPVLPTFKPHFHVMQKFLRSLFLIATLVAPVFAQQIGEVRVAAEKNTVPVRVSANTPELNALALQAIGSHGRYRVTGSG